MQDNYSVHFSVSEKALSRPVSEFSSSEISAEKVLFPLLQSVSILPAAGYSWWCEES